jgi:YVTN family beta-propeller protein
VVLYGGDAPPASASELNGTWVFSHGSWQLEGVGTAPPLMGGASMTYDAADGYVLWFGNDGTTSETWAFQVGHWTQLQPLTEPPIRYFASMAYDYTDGYVVLFGGWNNSADSGSRGDTWSFTGGSWTELESYNYSTSYSCLFVANGTSTSCPSPRAEAGLSWDGIDRYLVMFGGWDGKSSSSFQETWSFAGGHWTEQHPSTSPTSLVEPAISYDAVDKEVVLFGGANLHLGGCDVYEIETWTYQQGDWTLLDPSTFPSSRTSAMVWDSAESRIVLFGGGGNYGSAACTSDPQGDTWTFAHNNWTRVVGAGSPPGSFVAGVPVSNGLIPGVASMTYDAKDGYVLVYGGFSENTWEYSAGSWTFLNDTTRQPAQRDNAMMAYDPVDGYVVLFGGQGSTCGTQPSYLCGDTWEFSQGVWTQLSPVDSPSARYDASMTFDATDGEIVLFGGISYNSTGFQDLGDTWSFVDGNWTQVGSCGAFNQPSCGANAPSPRALASMAFDSADRYVVLFGGANSTAVTENYGTANDDTWTYAGGTWKLLTPSTSPSSRWGGGLVYDSAIQALVLYAGDHVSNGYPTPLSDIWSFSAGDWAMVSATGGPTTRFEPLVAFDSSDASVLVFGGKACGAPSQYCVADTWQLTLRPEYSVTFSQTGLPSGTDWSVDLGGSIASAITPANVTFSDPNGTYGFQVSPVPNFGATPSTGSVVIGGMSTDVPIQFTAATPSTYGVTFAETGLPSGSSWSASLNGTARGSTTASIQFTGITNGSYSFSVSSAGYTANPSSGMIEVSGANVSQSIAFTASGVKTYGVVFTESGLEVGSSWSISFDAIEKSSTSGSIAFGGIENGSYSFTASASGYTANPSSGDVNVEGANVTQAVAFTPTSVPSFTVAFDESGLPSGASWSVTLAGTMLTSTTLSVSFSEPNGSYAYSVQAPSGYTPTPSTGSVSVDGTNVGVFVKFSLSGESTYPVTFQESGLPKGTTWSVSVEGANETSTTSTLLFTETNGTYSYTIPDVADYTPTPSSGTLVIMGTSKMVTVVFASTSVLNVTWTLCLQQNSLLPGNAVCPPNALYPSAFATDSITGDVYVTNDSTSTVSIISGVNGLVTAIIPVGSFPEALAFDSSADTMYVANEGSNNVSVIDAGSERVVATIPVGNAPDGIAFDSANEDVYVANWGSNNVSVISTASNRVIANFAVGTAPDAAVFDPANGEVYVTNWGSGFTDTDTVSVISGSSNTVVATITIGLNPIGVAVDPSNGVLYIPNQGNVSVVSTATNLVLESIPVGDYPDGVAFDPVNDNVYVANGDSNTLSVVSTSTNSLVATIPVGLDPEGVLYDPSNGLLYVANDHSGSVSILGEVGNATTYEVTFQESGLPAGTSWQVTIASLTVQSITDSIVFRLANGNYSFRIADVPGWHETTLPYSGMLSVRNTTVNEPSIVFTRVTYVVTITEQGLPQGTAWNATIDGVVQVSNGASLSVSQSNGTFDFFVSTVGGYVPTPSSGTITVNGSAIGVTVDFAGKACGSCSPLSGEQWILIGVAGGAIVAASVGVVVWLRRRGP